MPTSNESNKSSIGAAIAGAMGGRPRAVSGDPRAPGGVTGGSSPVDWRNLYAFSTHGGTVPSQNAEQRSFWKHWNDLGQLMGAQVNRMPFVYDPFEASQAAGGPYPYFAPGATPERADIAGRMFQPPYRPPNNPGMANPGGWAKLVPGLTSAGGGTQGGGWVVTNDVLKNPDLLAAMIGVNAQQFPQFQQQQLPPLLQLPPPTD